MNGQIVALNVTQFFHRTKFLYAFGDFSLKKPIPLDKAAFIFGFVMVWSLPIFLLFGLKLEPFYLAFLIVPPIVLGHYATKQVFNGKTMIDFGDTLIEWAQEPRGWTDSKKDSMNETAYTITSEIWLSRRRDLQVLADLVEGKVQVVDDAEGA